MILERECTTYCNGEQDTIPHDIQINLDTGKVISDIDLKNHVYDYTKFNIITSDKKEREFAISSLTFLSEDDLRDLRDAVGYVIEEETETEED